MAAWHAQAMSEDTLGDLRVILDETLDRIKTEVFASKAASHQPGDTGAGPAPDTGPAPQTGQAPGAGPAPDTGPAPQTGPGTGGDH